jgi:hypothetical protein
MTLRLYVSFVNPRSSLRETIWFRTEADRQGFLGDLRHDWPLGSLALRLWESNV